MGSLWFFCWRLGTPENKKAACEKEENNKPCPNNNGKIEIRPYRQHKFHRPTTRLPHHRHHDIIITLRQARNVRFMNKRLTDCSVVAAADVIKVLELAT